MLVLATIRDVKWQRRFLNGFHLRMLYNSANVFTGETRFLSNMVIWEWLFSRLKGKESDNRTEIIAGVLIEYWHDETNHQVFGKGKRNILYVLRNQLAHSGRLPIDRPYADSVMRRLSGDDVGAYQKLFDTLTQTVVLKTLGLDYEQRDLAFQSQLQTFLKSGYLS